MATASGYGTIVANGTVVVKNTDAILRRIFALDPGSSWVVSLYDASTAATATAAQLRWRKTLAANDNIELNLPMQNGITIINTGTPGTMIAVWQRG